MMTAAYRDDTEEAQRLDELFAEHMGNVIK